MLNILNVSESQYNKFSYEEFKKYESSIKKNLRLNYAELNKISKSRVAKSDETALSYNKWFKKEYGRGEKEAIKRFEKALKSAKDNKAKIDVYKEYSSTLIRRHEKESLTTLKGIEKRKIQQLKGLKKSINAKGSVERVDKRGIHGYRIGGTFYSDIQLSKIFDMLHKAAELGETATLKGGTNTALKEITSMYIGNNDITMNDVIGRINTLYETQMQEEYKIKREQDLKLEEIKKTGKVWGVYNR